MLFSSQTASSLVGFLSSVVIARAMEPAEMGRLTFCLTVIVISGLFFEFGVFSAGSRVLALTETRDDERRALGALVLMGVAISGAFCLFIAAAAATIDAIFKTEVRLLLVAAAALAFFQPFQWLIELSCQGLNQIRRLSVFQLLSSSTYLAGLTLLALNERLAAGSALLAYLTALAVSSLWTITRLRPSFSGTRDYVRLTIREARRFGFNLYLSRVTGTVSGRVDNLMIAYFLRDMVALGLYGFAQKLSGPMVTASRALAVSRFRAFATLDRVPARVVRWNLALLVSSAAALAIFGPLVVRFAFPKYAGATSLLVPFAVFNLFAGLFQPYNIFLAAHGRGAEIRNIAATVTAASLAGLALAVPRLGIQAAAWTGAGAMALDYLLHLYYYSRFRRVEAATRAAAGPAPEVGVTTPKQDEQVVAAAALAPDSMMKSAPRTDEAKLRAREQWTANPCGAHVARQHVFGTREYFDAIEAYRYRVYAPWMREAMGFDNYYGKRLLELGCGTGTDLLQFARGGALVTGVDLTPRSIEIARKRFEAYGLAGEFMIADAEGLPFPDESFDVIYSFGVLHHTPDTERGIAEVHRVLRKGGRAIVMLYNRRSLYYWGGLMLKRGLLGGELFRLTPAEIMSRHVEYTETGGRPLVRAYTRAAARRLFRRFSESIVQVNQLTRDDLGVAGRALPESLFQWLARNFGWNLIITATK